MVRKLRYDAFLSYRQGDEPFLEMIKQYLVAHGYKVVDREQFSGNNHKEDAERKLNESQCAIFIFNPKRGTLKENNIEDSFQLREMRIAIKRSAENSKFFMALIALRDEVPVFEFEKEKGKLPDELQNVVSFVLLGKDIDWRTQLLQRLASQFDSNRIAKLSVVPNGPDMPNPERPLPSSPTLETALPGFLLKLFPETDRREEAEKPRAARLAPPPTKRKQALEAPPSKWWSEVMILDKRYRVFATESRINVVASNAPLDPAPRGTSLVVDPEGRAALWLRDGVLKLTWLNRYAEKDLRTATLPRREDLADGRLLAVSMCGPAGVRAVASGRGGNVMLRIEPDEPDQISCKALPGQTARGAVILDAMDAILINAGTGKPSPTGLMLGLDAIECIDEADTIYGRLRVAVGTSKSGERTLVMHVLDNNTTKQSSIEHGPPQGLTIVRNAKSAIVLYAADNRIMPYSFVEGGLS